MSPPRRHLPSIASLLALEAVDRLGSATAAAEELSLTHSAISRQIKVLEGQLGVPVVVRSGAGLALTPAAREFCAAARRVLDELSQASLALRSNPAGGTVSLAVLPAFATDWLTPRLAGFVATAPDVNVTMSTRLAPFDFDQHPFDAAIHFGRRDWPGVCYLPLAEERLVAVVAPELQDRAGELPLLRLATRPGAWDAWCRAEGDSAEGRGGMVFDQFATMAEAAVRGLGLALIPDFQAEREISAGRLSAASPRKVTSRGSYWLVWPESRPMRKPLETFVDWVKDET